MKMKFNSKEFEISWIELVALIVIIYLLITGDMPDLVEIIKSLKK